MGKKTELYFRIDYNGNGRERGRAFSPRAFSEKKGSMGQICLLLKI